MRKSDFLELSDSEIDHIKAIITDFELEDKAVRERQIRTWKKMEWFWNGFTQIYWDDVAHDWRVFGYSPGNTQVDNDDNQAGYYDKNINVYRAYLETIIAALSASVPPVKCVPDDVNNPSDINTAKGGNHVAKLIYDHNDMPLLWVRMLWTYCQQGMVAIYNYTDEDKSYGEVDVPETEDVEVNVERKTCPFCGTILEENEVNDELIQQEKDEYDPDDEDIALHGLIDDGKIPCAQCAVLIDPQISRDRIVITRIVGTTSQPKARQCMKVEGGLFVKIANWARCQKDLPYIGYSYETHFTNIYEEFPFLMDELGADDGLLSATVEGNQVYERWGRLSPQYHGEYPTNTPTVRHWWLRKSAFNSIIDKDIRKKLRKKFPDGCYAVLVNEHWVGACNENLDDHWTISINPESNFVHYDPLGILVTAVQEITADLVSLELQCVEHSIPQTFFDPRFLNAEQYRNTEIIPGALYPTKNIPGGKGVSDGFFTLQTATVSPEISPFGAQINEMGQFVSGATPQVWGGSSGSGSRTASQYAMQRNQSLQRLNTPLKMIKTLLKTAMGKVIPAYFKCMVDDEHYTRNNGMGFDTVVIRKMQMDGKIGSVELDAPDGLPQTLDQIKDTIMSLMNTGNPDIMAALFAPQNLGFLAQVIGIDQFSIPGEDDREKQYEEIKLLMLAGPIPGAPIMTPMGPQMGPEQPSVMPEFMVDNHKVEADICRSWLVSEAGRQAKEENPDGYKNVLLHLQIHVQMMQALSAPPPGMPPQQQPEQGGKVQPPKAGKVAQMRPVNKPPVGEAANA